MLISAHTHSLNSIEPAAYADSPIESPPYAGSTDLSPTVALKSIGVLVVDDHPIVLRGLIDLLAGEPGIVVLAGVERHAQALNTVRQLAPDVAVVDFHLAGENGLELACRLGALPRGPRVVVYSAFPGVSLIAAAMVAEAHAVIAKSALPHELIDAIRGAREGRRTLPALTRTDLTALATRLPREDRPLLGMFAHGIPAPQIARTIGVSEAEMLMRRQSMVRALSGHSHAVLSAMQGGALHYSHGRRS
jgi:DNA-binding NarL/FixJ family response regulator